MNDYFFYIAFGAFFVFVIGKQIMAARRRIPGEQARSLVKSGAILVDVRSSGEFASGHLPGAVNYPLHELGRRLEGLPAKGAIVVYCHSGARSARAFSMLKRAGREVHDLGPQRAWST